MSRKIHVVVGYECGAIKALSTRQQAETFLRRLLQEGGTPLDEVEWAMDDYYISEVELV